MSTDLNSGIFSDLIGYSRKYADDDIEIKVSNKPISGCNVYHYHRPQLEKKLEKNSIVTVHHDLNDDDKWHLFENFEDQYRQAKKIVCLNTLQQTFLKDKGFHNTIVIPHGFNENIFSAENKPVRDVVNLGVVSRHYGRKVKGEALLYDLMMRLDRNKIRFTFVGKDRTQDCWKARDLGYTAQVFERLPYKVFGGLYKSLDALLIPSIFEGGPANVPEAIATGTPLFAKRVGMIEDYLDESRGIFLTGNPDIDARNINQYAKNKEYQKSIKLAAYLYTDSAITWKEVTRQQLSVYREVAL